MSTPSLHRMLALPHPAPALEFALRWRGVRACARCHRLKMKCVYLDPEHQQCQRCFQVDAVCLMEEDSYTETPPLRKRQRGQTLERITDPIARLEALLAAGYRAVDEIELRANQPFRMEAKSGSVPPGLSDSVSPNTVDERGNSQPPGPQLPLDKLYILQKQCSDLQQLLLETIERIDAARGLVPEVASSVHSMKNGPVKPVPRLPAILYTDNIMRELLRLKYLTTKDARTRFMRFTRRMLAFWPCVVFPPLYTYDHLLEHLPLLLLALILVTALNEPDLHDRLMYYLDRDLAQRVLITGELTVELVQVCVIILVWLLPPRTWGSYKHQMNLMLALNLSLCLDLGHEKWRVKPKADDPESDERQAVRAYIAVYASCGSLGLSLPRFKLLSFLPSYHASVRLLGEAVVEEGSDSGDRFLANFALLVSLGLDVYDFLNADTQQFGRPFGNSPPDPATSPPTADQTMHFWATVQQFERRLVTWSDECGLLDRRYKVLQLLRILYHQIMLTMYDYAVCRRYVLTPRGTVALDAYHQALQLLVDLGEKIVDAFVKLCERTDTFPTFFYYRPMQALVALIRARLLVALQRLPVVITVELSYDRVAQAMKAIAQRLLVAVRMGDILTKVSRWIKLTTQMDRQQVTATVPTNGVSSKLLVVLLDQLGHDKAIEALNPPATARQGGSGSGSEGLGLALRTGLDSDATVLFSGTTPPVPVRLGVNQPLASAPTLVPVFPVLAAPLEETPPEVPPGGAMGDPILALFNDIEAELGAFGDPFVGSSSFDLVMNWLPMG